MTARTLNLFCMAIVAILLTGCLAARDERPPPVTTPDSAWLSRSAKMDASLAAYRAQGHSIEPCQTSFLETLRSAQREAVILNADLEKQADYRGYTAEDGYRGEALRFYQKNASTLANLTQLETSASSYCTADAARVAACFDQQDPVRVSITRDAKGEELGVKATSESPLLVNMPKPEMQTALGCLQTANLKTDLGQQLTHVLQTACEL